MQYGLPLILLVLTALVFFFLGRRGFHAFGRAQLLLRLVVALPLLFSGVVLHFIRAAETASIIPPIFPTPVLLVAISGICEVLGAAGLFVPTWRRTAGILLVLLMIAVFPANVYVAGRVVSGLRMPGIGVRTAMQAAFIVMILLASFGLPRVGMKESE